MTPQQFIKKWKQHELTERAAAQPHFIDLCVLVGHEDPITADPKGEWFTFEKGATKTGGGKGFADVWKKGFFAWEYKKRKRNLDEALAQLVRYAAALENPPLQVACDTDRFLIRTAWTNAVPKIYEIALDDLGKPKNLDLLHSVFFDPDKLRPKQTRAGVTKEAADKFSTIALRLQGRSMPEEIAHFVNQLVFCFFAHSVKLLPNGFFPRLLKRCAESPQNAKRYFDGLFAAMEKGGDFDLTHIAHFNGGLFDGRRALPLDSDDVGLLIAAGSLDWSQIDPSIFGTLFERFLDPEKRGQIGAHYTDSDKIMMIVEPVVLRPLREEWATIREKIAPIAEKAAAIRPKTQSRGDWQDADAAARRTRAPAIVLRDEFLQRLNTLRILDPACGSGNFLYLTLQGVKDIENRVVLECEAMDLPPRSLAVGPEILRGIEINALAAELARTTIWIGDIQWAIRNGIYTRPEPILRPLDSIECRDALIATDGKGGFAEAEWPQADYIIGNPPFLGANRFNSKMGAEETEGLRKVFERRVPQTVDLSAYWIFKATNKLKYSEIRTFGLLATSAIRAGNNLKFIDSIGLPTFLFEVWSDEPWVLEGASVRVSILCATAGPTD
jgi:type II restriction/modification system DNA methylase subunit YeeA